MRADWEREALAALEHATSERHITHDQMVTVVAEALESLIRADERERIVAAFEGRHEWRCDAVDEGIDGQPYETGLSCTCWVADAAQIARNRGDDG